MPPACDPAALSAASSKSGNECREIADHQTRTNHSHRCVEPHGQPHLPIAVSAQDTSDTAAQHPIDAPDGPSMPFGHTILTMAFSFLPHPISGSGHACQRPHEFRNTLHQPRPTANSPDGHMASSAMQILTLNGSTNAKAPAGFPWAQLLMMHTY